MKPFLRQQLARFADRLGELEFLLSREDIMKDMKQFLVLSREHTDVSAVTTRWARYQLREADLAAAALGLDDLRGGVRTDAIFRADDFIPRRGSGDGEISVVERQGRWIDEIDGRNDSARIELTRDDLGRGHLKEIALEVRVAGSLPQQILTNAMLGIESQRQRSRDPPERIHRRFQRFTAEADESAHRAPGEH